MAIVVVLLVGLVVGGVVLAVTQGGDDDSADGAAVAAEPGDESPDAVATTEAPEGPDLPTFEDMVEGDLEAPQGSVAAFCALNGSYQRTIELRAAIVAAPNAAEAEALAEEALPLMNELLAAAPAEVFEPVRSARNSIAPMTIWSDSDERLPDGGGASPDGLAEDIRMRYKFSVQPPDPDPVQDFLAGC